jgi:hypothetical protein
MTTFRAGSLGVSSGPPPKGIDQVKGSERKDNARTDNHEEFCGNDALPILCRIILIQSPACARRLSVRRFDSSWR